MGERQDLAALLAAKEMIVICGSGGVGKTTIAAALATEAAISVGGRVLVLTVDPARRLADSLGIGAFGNEAVRVPDEAFGDVTPRGELWAAMLDTKAGWDELIERHAPDAATRDAVLSNPLYQNITSRFVHSHDYLAMEQLHDLHASGEYDLIIVDTPPSRNALDVLDAPAKMREFFGSRLLKWLTAPYSSRLFALASKPFYQIADRILGSSFLEDIAEFFILFQLMERDFVRHANEVEQLLGDRRSSFVVVSTLEAAPSHEAEYLARELQRRDLELGAVVANRALPASFNSTQAAASAKRLVSAADGQLAADVAGSVNAEEDAVAAVLREVGERFADLAVVAKRERERRRSLATMTEVIVTVPIADHEINDVIDLRSLLR